MPLRTDRLRALREQRDWSRRKLGQLCGFAEAQISKYEAGEVDPSATYLGIMADVLEVSTDYLLGRSDSPTFIIEENTLSQEERDILHSYRRQGWRGVLR